MCGRRRKDAPVCFAFDEYAKLILKTLPSEARGVPAQAFYVEFKGSRFKALDCFTEAGDGLLFEKDSGFAVDHGFQSAAAAKGDHWRSRGLRFDGDDAEVFFGGEYQRLAGFKMFFRHAVRLPI